MAIAALAPLAAWYFAPDSAPSSRAPAAAFIPAARSENTEPPVTAAPAYGNVTGNPDAAGNRPLTLTELEQRIAAADPGARDLLLAEVLPAMVASNPDDIARFAELQTDPQLREILIRQVAQAWAKTDADRAMAWAKSLPDSPERVATLIDVSLAVALTDPQRAVQIREPEVGNLEPDGVLEGLLQQWAQQDFDAALSWANARPRGTQRDKLLQRLVYVRAATGALDVAARMIDESFEEGPQKLEAVAIVAQQWARADPVAANAWLLSLDGEKADVAIQYIAPLEPLQ